jgi:hypothetical protein
MPLPKAARAECLCTWSQVPGRRHLRLVDEAVDVVRRRGADDAADVPVLALVDGPVAVRLLRLLAHDLQRRSFRVSGGAM